MDSMDRPRITIFDTTLRDGEQSPGCSMNVQEKVRLAQQLDILGVDVIEAGFPLPPTATSKRYRQFPRRSDGQSLRLWRVLYLVTSTGPGKHCKEQRIADSHSSGNLRHPPEIQTAHYPRAMSGAGEGIGAPRQSVVRGR